MSGILGMIPGAGAAAGAASTAAGAASATGAGIPLGVALQGISMLGGLGQGRRQYHRQKKLMGFQKGHQMDLNEHGHQLQMDMWNKTNYKAQLEHMKKAGLNPALMYGSAGQGGQTGSQGGGAAAGGSAVAERVMDLSSMLTEAQIEDLRASAEKKRAESDKIEGVDTELTSEQSIGQKLGNEITEKSSDAQIGQMFANLEKTLEEKINIMVQNQFDIRTIEDRIAIIAEETVAKALENSIGLKTEDAQVNRIVSESIRQSIGVKDDTLQLNVSKLESRLADDDLVKGDPLKGRFIIQGFKNVLTIINKRIDKVKAKMRK